MIIGHITTPQIEELGRTGQAVITEKPAGDGVVSFPVAFERENERFSYKHNRRWIAEDSLALHGYAPAGEVLELRQALTEQHNRMAGRIAELSSGWQSIDTAPMDGTPLMLFARAVHATAPVLVIGWHNQGMGWIDSVFCPNNPTRVVPTHWMALPAFPGDSTTRAAAHLPAVDRDALCLSLLTDDQAVMTLDRIKESRRLSYVASIFSSVPE